MRNDISNFDDIIDSRDIIARIEELESCYDVETFEDNLDEDERDELLILKTFAEEESWNCSDWEDGATLIHDNYFQQYAEDYADDIGAIGTEHQWPLQHIDWEAAAEDLQQDFTSLDFDGETYWVRS
jgi:hypothetical protein